MQSYKFEIEIYEGNGGKLKKDKNGNFIYPEDLNKEKICAWMYRGDGKNSYYKGQIFNYPEDAGKLCPWMLPNITQVIQILQADGKLGWRYENTAYEKKIEENGITTEFIRCMDPTDSGIVIKVIKKSITESK